jgi:hypothetical protein
LVGNQPWAKYLTKEDGTGGVARNKKAYLKTNYETTNENTTSVVETFFWIVESASYFHTIPMIFCAQVVISIADKPNDIQMLYQTRHLF